MDIALILVNCKFDSIIDRTLCNYMTLLCIVTCSNLVFYYYGRGKTSFEYVNIRC